MKTIVASAILGAIGGGVGGLLGALLGKLFAKSKEKARPNYGAIVGVVVAVSISNGMGVKDKVADLISPPSPIEAFGKQLIEIPGVKDRIEGMSAAEVQATTQQLSASGMLKLETHHLVTRVKLIGEMLRTADVSKCGRFAKGTLTGDDLSSMMTSLSPDHQAEWFSLIKAAVEAEVGGKPAPELPNEAAIGDAMAKVTEQVAESDRQRFGTSLGAMTTLSEGDACWTAKALYDAVGRTSGTAQSVVARALLMP